VFVIHVFLEVISDGIIKACVGTSGFPIARNVPRSDVAGSVFLKKMPVPDIPPQVKIFINLYLYSYYNLVPRFGCGLTFKI
jgi:hypothetical protein